MADSVQQQICKIAEKLYLDDIFEITSFIKWDLFYCNLLTFLYIGDWQWVIFLNI